MLMLAIIYCEALLCFPESITPSFDYLKAGLLLLAFISLVILVRYMQFRRNKHIVRHEEVSEPIFEAPNVLGLESGNSQMSLPKSNILQSKLARALTILFVIFFLLVGIEL